MDHLAKAKSVYRILCQALDNRQWHYNKDEEEMTVITAAVGEDLTMGLQIMVDVERQVMYLKSPMPFHVPENTRDGMARAILMANYYMLNGSFEFDYGSGYIAFKIVIPFMQSIISEDVCAYMIDVACDMADMFNDKFHALAMGQMTLKEFEDFVNQQ